MKQRSHGLILFLLMILVIPSITCTVLNPKSDSPQRQPDEDSSEDVQSDDPGADLPEATGDEIEITQTATYLDEFGYWNIHGLITNVADYSVGGIELEVQIAGAAESESTFVGAYGITSGEIQPFGIRLPLSVTSVDEIEINVLQIRRIVKEPVQLEISQTKLKTAENGIVTLAVELQNNTNSPALVQSVNTALFSADGELITTASCQVCPGYLDLGEKGPAQFLIYGHPQDAAIDHNEIYISAVEAPSVEGLVFNFVDPVHTYTDPAGAFHVFGELQNNSDKILALQLVGTFYNQNGEIVGASSYKLPGNSLAPGESSPYELILINPIELVTDWSIQVDLAHTSERVSPAVQLSATTTDLTKDSYLWTISGNVVNDSEQSLQLITVVVGLRDGGTGKLVGLTQHFEAGDFPAGATIDYSLDISPDPAFDPGSLEEFILLLGE